MYSFTQSSWKPFIGGAALILVIGLFTLISQASPGGWILVPFSLLAALAVAAILIKTGAHNVGITFTAVMSLYVFVTWLPEFALLFLGAVLVGSVIGVLLYYRRS